MLKVALVFALSLLLAPSAHAKGSKPPKAAPGPAESVSRAAACQARFDGLCAAMQRCAANTEDLGGAKCEAIDPGCDKLTGTLPVSTATLEACVAGLRKLTCSKRGDPSEFLDLESRVAECRPLALADATRERVNRTATASR